MLTLPDIVRKKKQHYVAIRAELTMRQIGSRGPKLSQEVAKWAEAKGIAVGAAFFRYNVIDMQGLLDMEFGFFTEKALKGEGKIEAGSIPAGRYVSLTWFGSPAKLYDVTAVLIGWGRERAMRWDGAATEKGDSFACRMEIYKTDPAEEPDMDKWETEIVIKLAE
jgi:effector-binding domain-containing protein